MRAVVGVVWSLIVTGMGEGAIKLVERIATPGSGHLKLNDLPGEVRPELLFVPCGA